jgi:hypothetical protein
MLKEAVEVALFGDNAGSVVRLFIVWNLDIRFHICFRMRGIISGIMMIMMIIWTIGVLGFASRQGLGIFLFTTASRTALGPTQPPIQRVPGTLSLGVKRPGREAYHSPPCSAEVKE